MKSVNSFRCLLCYLHDVTSVTKRKMEFILWLNTFPFSLHSLHTKDMQSWLWHTFVTWTPITWHTGRVFLFLNLVFLLCTVFKWYQAITNQSKCTETESRHVDAKSLVIIWLCIAVHAGGVCVGGGGVSLGIFSANLNFPKGWGSEPPSTFAHDVFT